MASPLDLLKRRLAPLGPSGIATINPGVANDPTKIRTNASFSAGPQGLASRSAFGTPGTPAPPPVTDPNNSPTMVDLLNQFLQSRQPDFTQDSTYDPDFENNYNTLVKKESDLASGLDTSNQQDRLDAANQQADIERQQSDALEAVKQRMADQGILYSGGNINAQGKVREGYSNQSKGVLDSLQKAIEGRAKTFQGAQDTFGESLNQLFLDHAQKLAAAEQAAAQAQAEASVLNPPGTTPGAPAHSMITGNTLPDPSHYRATPIATPTGQFAPNPSTIMDLISQRMLSGARRR